MARRRKLVFDLIELIIKHSLEMCMLQMVYYLKSRFNLIVGKCQRITMRSNNSFGATLACARTVQAEMTLGAATIFISFGHISSREAALAIR